MPINELSGITYLGNTYRLFDDTVVGLHEETRAIYHFVNKGTLLSQGGGRFIDDHCVSEAVISAKSFLEAIELFVKCYHLQHNSEITVELIGNDSRAVDADPYLMHLVKMP